MREPDAPEATRLPDQALPDWWGLGAEAGGRDDRPDPAGMLALEPLDEMSEESQDPAELALVARLRGREAQLEQQECNFAQAAEHVLWALEAERRGPSAAQGERKAAMPWGLLAWRATIASSALLTLLLLLALTRANFAELALEGGTLLAAGVPAYAGEQPLAATSRALERRGLAACAGLPPAALGRLREVSLVHRGEWRSLRVARVLRFGAAHLWLEAADGGGVRLQAGRAWVREGRLGDEERLALGGEAYGGLTVRPEALFDATVLPGA